MLPGSLAAGKALPTDVQALAKEEWADAMAAATAAADHARRAQEASNAAERFAQQVGWLGMRWMVLPISCSLRLGLCKIASVGKQPGAEYHACIARPICQPLNYGATQGSMRGWNPQRLCGVNRRMAHLLQQTRKHHPSPPLLTPLTLL